MIWDGEWELSFIRGGDCISRGGYKGGGRWRDGGGEGGKDDRRGLQ